MSEATASTPSPEDLHKSVLWLKKRFWYLGAIILVVNALVVSLGLPLLSYMSEEYINKKLTVHEQVIDAAKAKALAAHQASEDALKEALSAGVKSADVELISKKLGNTLSDVSSRLSDVAAHLNEYKTNATERLPRLRQDIESAKVALGTYQKVAREFDELRKKNESLEHYFKKNNTRIAWRSAELPFTPRDDTRPFAVDFSPDVPEPGRVTVLIRGIALWRQEHNVSVMRAHVQNVQVSGSKVTGEYRCTLSDNDKNGPNGGAMSLDVLAQIKPAN